MTQDTARFGYEPSEKREHARPARIDILGDENIARLDLIELQNVCQHPQPSCHHAACSTEALIGVDRSRIERIVSLDHFSFGLNVVVEIGCGYSILPSMIVTSPLIDCLT